jgi:membrane-associated protease RseP (regulator of RpoE activity)
MHMQRPLVLAALGVLAALVAVSALAFGALEATRGSPAFSPAPAGEQAQQDGNGDGPAWLGVIVVPAPFEAGVRIARVAPGGPAGEAGLKAADRIIAVDGEPVSDVDDLRAAIGEHAPGDTVALTVFRWNREMPAQVEVTLAEGPGSLFRRGEISDQREGLFDRFLGGEFRYLDEDGKAVTIEIAAGRLAAVTPEEITIELAGEQGERAFSLEDDARVPSGLREGDRVVIITKDGDLQAVTRGLPGLFGRFPFLLFDEEFGPPPLERHPPFWHRFPLKDRLTDGEFPVRGLFRPNPPFWHFFKVSPFPDAETSGRTL